MPGLHKNKGSLRSRFFPGLLGFLFVSAIYLYAFPEPNLVYPAVVLLHVAAGVVATLLLLIYLAGLLRKGSFASGLGWVLLGGGGIVGLILIKTGTTRPELNLLYAHIGLCLVGVGLVFADWLGKRGWLGAGAFAAMLRTAVCLLTLVGARRWCSILSHCPLAEQLPH